MKWKYENVFPKAHTFLAVVHVEDAEQALRNVKIARDGGADGVFLINHNIPAFSLMTCYQYVRKRHPDCWIGMNILDLDPLEALRELPADCDALWTDSIPPPQTQSAYQFSELLAERQARRNMLYFGGVAFKGQHQGTLRPDEAARRARSMMDVITTSGQGTGWPPTIEKIQQVRNGAGEMPIAIASGMSAENVSLFKGLANCFMVASSIEKSFSELEPYLVRRFADEVELMNS